MLDKQFRDELLEKEYKFAKKVSDPKKVAEWWDNFFQDIHKKYPKIRKNSSGLAIKLRLLLILVSNRIYIKKLKRLFNAEE